RRDRPAIRRRRRHHQVDRPPLRQLQLDLLGQRLRRLRGNQPRRAPRRPLARRRPRLGRRPLVRCLRDPRLEDPARVHLSRSRLRREGHPALSLARESLSREPSAQGPMVARTTPDGSGTNRVNWVPIRTAATDEPAPATPIPTAGSAGGHGVHSVCSLPLLVWMRLSVPTMNNANWPLPYGTAVIDESDLATPVPTGGQGLHPLCSL